MWFCLCIAAVCIIYVRSFKEDFTEEHINKVQPVLVLLVVLVLLIGILQSMLK